MCCYTGFEVSSPSTEAQTMRDCTVEEWGLQDSVWERVCLCGLDPTWKAALSAGAVICVLKDTFLSRSHNSAADKYIHFSRSHILMCKNNQRANENKREAEMHTGAVSAHLQPETNTRVCTLALPAHKQTHKQLSVVLAISMGNNHGLYWEQIENLWWVFHPKQSKKHSEQPPPQKKKRQIN